MVVYHDWISTLCPHACCDVSDVRSLSLPELLPDLSLIACVLDNGLYRLNVAYAMIVLIRHLLVYVDLMWSLRLYYSFGWLH